MTVTIGRRELLVALGGAMFQQLDPARADASGRKWNFAQGCRGGIAAAAASWRRALLSQAGDPALRAALISV